MSAIQSIDVAMPNLAMPASANEGSRAAGQGNQFAEVMRSAVAPAHARQAGPNDSGASASSRLHPDRSTTNSATNSSPVDPISTDSSQAPTQASQGSNGDGQNAASFPGTPSIVSVQAEDGATSMQGPVAPITQPGEVAGRSGGVSQPPNVPSTTKSASSSAAPARKQATSGHGSSSVAIGGVSVSSAIAISVPVVGANVPGIATNSPAARLFGSRPAGPTASALPVATPQHDGTGGKLAEKQQVSATGKAAGIMPDGVGVSNGETAAAQNFSQTHAGPGNDGRPPAWNSTSTASVTASSAANENVGAADVAKGSQPVGTSDGNAVNAPANGLDNSAPDSNMSTTSSSSAMGNLGASASNGPIASGGNGDPNLGHNSDASKGASSASAVSSTAAATAKGIEGALASSVPVGAGVPHLNTAGSGVGTQGGSSVFSASTANMTAVRGTTSDAFTALDSAPAGERGVLLHAGPHQVSVGVSDPSLGWVEVRAERISGQVTAALATNSAASHAALTSVLPSMANYLQEHHAGVQQVHVETALAGGQAGTGSQGQTHSQNDARTSTDNVAIANSGNSGGGFAPVGGGAILASHATSSMNEGHHFSIRA